jgi:hypothetical protein
MSFVRSSGFASGLAFGELPIDEDAGLVDIAVLGNAGDEEHAVDPPVPAVVEAMPHRRGVAFSRRQRDRSGAAPARELRLASEPERITDLGEQRRSGDRSNAGFVKQGGAVLIEEPIEIAFELMDLAAGLAVVIDERHQPRQPVGARHRRHDRGVDVFETAQA